MRDISAELTIFGGKALIIFVFIFGIVEVLDLHIKKLNINTVGTVEFFQRLKDEKAKSMDRDIQAGNIENPSDTTLYLENLTNSLAEYIFNNISANDIINSLEKNIDNPDLISSINAPPINRTPLTPHNTTYGYIFIGNFDNNKWNTTMFAEQKKTPEDIQKGETLTLTSNLYLRAEMPTNSDEYYHNIKSIKILPKGTKVTILGKPIGIKRKHATQWWVPVSY